MTTTLAPSLSRPFAIGDLPPEGLDVTVEATPEEREALAHEFKLSAIRALTGTLHLSGDRKRVRVSGRVDATVGQVCVVTLEPFDSDIREDIDVEFAAPGAEGDEADEIVNGTVDLGALTAEFLALGLDPYPRKPGVDFTFEAGEEPAPSPFAALAKLKRD